MTINPKALANSLAMISFVAFVICMLWASIDKSSFVSFWESWAHGFNLGQLVSDDVGSINLKSILGLVSFTATSWITGFSLAWLYNKLEKEV